MNWWNWAMDTGIGCGNFLLKLAIIIFPLMISVELLKYFHIVEKLEKPLTPLMRVLGLPNQAAYPLMAGLLLGMVYGGGLIVEDAKKGLYTKRQIMLISIFLCLCHSVFEDHMVIMSLGAPGISLLLLRLFLAIVLVSLLSRVWNWFSPDQRQ
ncbi:MAG: nucleoside recognition domain-containing protein, partial [Clostridiales bacterium]